MSALGFSHPFEYPDHTVTTIAQPVGPSTYTYTYPASSSTMSLASTAPVQSGSTTSSVPALAEPFEPAKTDKVRGPAAALGITNQTNISEKKSKMRGLFGIGKKKPDDPTKPATRSDPAAKNAASSSKLSKDAISRRSTASPILTDSSTPVMPSSPRLSSPAGSQIFERDVQESVLLPNSPAIPSHIKTEDHVPSVLDASSEAITDTHLNPDCVEIITHANHHPASLNVIGHPDHLSNASWQDDLAASLSASDFRPVSDLTESGSNYGSLDSADVRRLSFISFADVVQAEHQGHAGMGGSRESIHLAGLTSLSSMGNMDHRSPSPIRSPVSSTTGDPPTSSPNSKPVSLRGTETSPSRKPFGSPVSTALSMSPLHGAEVNVETMAQALKRTESGDLTGIKSHPTSPIDLPSR